MSGIYICRYDTTTGDWEQITALTHRRHNSAGVVLDGFVYVVGGSSECPLQSVERYNPRTKSWSMVGNLKVPRSHHRCCSVNGSIYAVGGKRNLASIEKYDKQIDTWTVVSCRFFFRIHIFQSLTMNIHYC